MEKKYVKLNISDNHLSLGNLFKVIKNHSNIKSAALQTELFCVLFEVEAINETTVNNYCTGYRAIADKYKQKYLFMRKKFDTDKTIFQEIFANLLTVINSSIKTLNNFNILLKEFNLSSKIRNVCLELFNIAKNEKEISLKKINEWNLLLNDNDYYTFFIEILFFTIIDKKQPIYEKDIFANTVENFIANTYLSNSEINDILELSLTGGLFSIRSLKELAKKDNPVACFQLGSMELKGMVTGKARYNVAYKYFEIAAKKNHPSANWILGLLNYVEYPNTTQDYNLAWEYFKKSENLGCIAAINNIGLMYLQGNVPNTKKNEKKAMEYFHKAANKGYIFANNNLGLIEEKKKNYKEAIQYYLISANQGESWSANRVGEFYRLGLGVDKNLNEAFNYYKIAIDSPESESTPWGFYNIAKYFYSNGCKEIGMEPDEEKAKKYFEIAKKGGIDIN